MNVLIIEDEKPAFEKLYKLVSNYLPQANILDWANSVHRAKEILETEDTLDLILADIQLQDGLSFSIFEDVTIECPIIFCTAFDQYLFKAFQTNGIAYLLKPFNNNDFKVAIDKYKKLFKKSESSIIPKQTFEDLRKLIENKRIRYKSRFSIKKKDGIKLLETDEIICFLANGDFCFAIDAAGAKHIINLPMNEINSKINPADFFRINRSEIVNIRFIVKMESYFQNRLSIKLTGLETKLITSRTKTAAFRKWIDA